MGDILGVSKGSEVGTRQGLDGEVLVITLLAKGRIKPGVDKGLGVIYQVVTLGLIGLALLKLHGTHT